MSDWRSEVLTYWFGLDPKEWWRSEPAIDEQIRERFLQLWSSRQLIMSVVADQRTVEQRV